MILDPVFYAFAIPAVVVTGLAKGGIGGSVGILSVPIMSLAISPVTAAAIMLPILILMDVFGLLIYRQKFDAGVLRLFIPVATIGVVIGYFTASLVSDGMVRLLVGLMAGAFVLDYWFRPKVVAAAAPSRLKGWILGTICGFTSFVSHAGGPPFQLYAMPLKLEKTAYIGTSVVLFATINALKLIPYFLLGQFGAQNLSTSAVLLPLAPLSIFAGAWIIRYVNQEVFYRMLYAILPLIAAKLIWDGAGSLMAP